MDYKKAIETRNLSKTFFEGKEKITLAQIVERHPDGLHLTGIYNGNGKFGEYAAVTCTEEPNYVIFCGKFMLELLEEWTSEVSITKINEDWKANPVPFKFEKKVTQNGVEYWEVI